MSRKRVPWDGPDPHAGDYLEGRAHGVLWLIRGVDPLGKPDISGARLTLDLLSTTRSAIPDAAVVHPWSRTEPSDPAGPPRVRQIEPTSRAAVMKAAWRDPDDLRINARRAREVSGWRTYCPLRRMAQYKGSQITDRHIAAADQLRLSFDVGSIGLSAGRDGMPISTVAYGPRHGPSDAARAQPVAVENLRRALARFTPQQQSMLDWIVLRNRTLASWCGRHLNTQVELGRLLGILDLLAGHYSAEVDRTLSQEGLVRAA